MGPFSSCVASAAKSARSRARSRSRPVMVAIEARREATSAGVQREGSGRSALPPWATTSAARAMTRSGRAISVPKRRLTSSAVRAVPEKATSSPRRECQREVRASRLVRDIRITATTFPSEKTGSAVKIRMAPRLRTSETGGRGSSESRWRARAA